MTITEKLTELTKGKNKAEIARRAGLKPTTISDYIAKEYTPRSDIALKMAHALNVPVDWLIDDDRGMPPPPLQKAGLSTVPDHELMEELCRRYWLELKRWEATIVAAEQLDWDKATKLAEHAWVERPLGDDVLRLFQMVDDLRQVIMFSRLQFNIDAFLRERWQQYADDAVDVERVDPECLRDRANKVLRTDGALAICDRLASQLDEFMAQASAGNRGVPFFLTHARRPQVDGK